MSYLQTYVKSILGTKFGHFNASYKGLEEKYGQPKMDTVPTYHYNFDCKDVVTSTFYNGNNKIAEAKVLREFSSPDNYPWWDDDYFEHAVMSDYEKQIHDNTTGLTYIYDGNRCNVIEIEKDDDYIAIADTNNNGILDKEDMILAGTTRFDITVGEFLDIDFEKLNAEKQAREQKAANNEEQPVQQNGQNKKAGLMDWLYSIFNF